MLSIAPIAFVLVIITLLIHALGFSVLVRFLVKSQSLKKTGFWEHIWLTTWLTSLLFLIHMAEIVVWGLFYFWQNCMPDIQSAIYFSGITYTTVGFGDLVLPEPWRMLAACEALSGILMCGLSTGLFFAVVQRIINNFVQTKLLPDAKNPPSIINKTE
jgi:hypothetical protein